MKSRKILADGDDGMTSSIFNCYLFFSYILPGFIVALVVSLIMQNSNSIFGESQEWMLRYMKEKLFREE